MSDSSLNHPILRQSFEIIDKEVGNHLLDPAEYAIARRIIHATADFEFLNLVWFSHKGITQGITALRQQTPIIVDVTMVKQGILTLVQKTFNNLIITAIEQADSAETGKTRTETGLMRCFEAYPQGVYIIGNAPTALLALCQAISQAQIQPALVIGVPVGFVSVVESKERLKELSVPQIGVNGRKGGSAVASAILNALILLAKESGKG